MSDFAPSDYQPSDTVTPTKWKAPSGTVWERTGERRQPERGEYIWHDTRNSEPYQYLGPPPSEDQTILNTPIWERSEDQAWEPPAAPVSEGDEIERLQHELTFSENYGKLSVAALVLQARYLKQIAETLGHLDYKVFSMMGSEGLENYLQMADIKRAPVAPVRRSWWTRFWAWFRGE